MAKGMIILPLVCLIAVSVFYVLATNSSFTITDVMLEDELDDSVFDVGGSQALNGTETDIEGDVTINQFTYTFENFAYSVIIASMAVIIGFSITILGSTLGASGGRAVAGVLFWYGLWFTFSVTGLLALLTIPVFGMFLYFILTLSYGIGVYETVG